MKLKLGLLNKDIAHRFGVSAGIVSKICRKFIPILAASLKNLIVWPDQGIIRQNLSEKSTKM